MVTLGNRDDELSDLLIQLRRFISGLSQDREAILGSLDSISDLSVETADLVTGIRKPLAKDVDELRKVAGTLDRNKAEIDRALQVLPIKLNKVGRTATYGSWFNFYLCNFKGVVKLPGIDAQNVQYNTGSPRCDIG
jgi:phospholipid/cholesterol/gamma-HCH transport system substrate-binding protein